MKQIELTFLEQEILSSFEKHFDLSKLNTIGVAVSGGADSICLLTAICRTFGPSKCIKVVSVNHNIRSAAETCGDLQFVQNYCRQLNIFCKTYEIPAGTILEDAKLNKQGVEDEARRRRYSCFQDFISTENIDVLCLAHNRNDKLETVLMRIFDGANVSSLASIQQFRAPYFRPLLNVSRQQIESYLEQNKIAFRTDSSNFDTNYYRNKIRNIVIPQLNENLEGWQEGVLSLTEKINLLNDYLENSVLQSQTQIEYNFQNQSVTLNLKEFLKLHDEIKIRILQKAVEDVKATNRINYQFYKEFILQIKEGKSINLNSCGISFKTQENLVIIEKYLKVATESTFFVKIEDEGEFLLKDKTFSVKKAENGVKFTCNENELLLKNLAFPFLVRSFQPNDEILTSEGKLKSVSKVFKDWKVKELKNDIPLIQILEKDKNGEFPIVCIWGQVFNFNNWILKDYK